MADPFSPQDTITSSQSSLKRTQQDSPSQSLKRGRPGRTPAVSSPIRKLLPKSTLPASVQPASLPVQDPRSGARPNTRTLRPKQSTICAAKQVLIKDYESRKTAAGFFPPTFSNHTTRIAIGRFQSHVDNVLANTKDVCANCGLFIVSGNLHCLHHDHPTLLAAFESRILVESDLNNFGRRGYEFLFCKTCYRRILESNPPKFGSTSQINVCECQSYPAALDGLTLVEEAVIARAHPVISILKLRPAGASFSASYQTIRGHAVDLPQNPGSLLTLLLSASLRLHHVIRVVWAGKRPHTEADIHPFGRVRKTRVLEALIWLRENNQLYKDVEMNHTRMDDWDDEFIPAGIKSRVLHCDPDSNEREGYATDLNADNHKNELHHAMSDAGLNDSGLLSGCLYTDADDAREHPIMKLVSAVTNYKRGAASTENLDLPILMYKNNGRPIPLNDWENPNYFTLAFPTLFPLGIGGHLAACNIEKRTKVSLEAWGKWALSHHSRR